MWIYTEFNLYTWRCAFKSMIQTLTISRDRSLSSLHLINN